jgi:CMP-N,N'-diacetyllegionaminic acid synthase
VKVYAVIPARGGSKGVPGKNIALLGGHPLIAYSIIAAKLCPRIGRVIVSTDSQEIAAIARQYGAEVPFMRPAEFAQDRSTDAEVFLHASQWFQQNEGVFPDLMVQLRPTTPLRVPAEVDKAIALLTECPQASGLRSAHMLAEPPHKMFQLTADGYFEGFFPDDPRSEYYNLPRQMLSKAYQPNGYVDIIRTENFLKTRSLYGGKILGVVTPFTIEVDTREDLERLVFVMNKEGHVIQQYLKAHFEAKG